MNDTESLCRPDRDEEYWHFFESKQMEYLKLLVDDEIIEEHRSNPLGQHSEPLARLLHYFRRLPMHRQYAIKKVAETGMYSIVKLSGIRGVRPEEVSDVQLSNVHEAYHRIFMLQIGQLMRG